MTVAIVDNQIPVGLHDDVPNVAMAARARGPQRLAVRAVQDKVRVALHDEAETSVRRSDGLARGFLPRRKSACLRGRRRSGRHHGVGRPQRLISVS